MIRIYQRARLLLAACLAWEGRRQTPTAATASARPRPPSC